MEDNLKEKINACFYVLVNIMKQNGLCFAFNSDKENFDNSILVILNALEYKDTLKLDGIQISLSELNKDLF